MRYRNRLLSTFMLFVVSVGACASNDRWLSFSQASALLAERGWQIHQDANGDLLFAAQSDARQLYRQDDDLAHRGAWSAVRKMFASRGWRADLAADGSLLLYPQQRHHGADVSPVATASTSQPNLGSYPPANPSLNQIRGALEPLGWRVEQERDGSLLFYPGHNRPKHNPRKAPPPVQDIASSQRHLNKTDRYPQLDGYPQLKSSLESSGWSVDRGADASVVLRTRVPSMPRSSIPAISRTTGPVPRRPVIDGFSRLRASLERAGWVVRRDVNGDTLLFPNPGISARV